MNRGESCQFTHNSSLSTVHSHAFTLAETLIVMGIIGVVAALTIPNVNKNTGRAEAVAKVKKIYAELNEAHNRATAVYGPIEKWFTQDKCNEYPNEQCTQRYYDRITEFMKLQKDCRNNSNCTKSVRYYLHNGNSGGFNRFPAAILAGGFSIRINGYFYPACNNSNVYNYSTCGLIEIDLDGPSKGKQSWGTDIFTFVITKEGIKPFGGGTNWTDSNIKSYCSYSGEYCAEWVIRNGNMDYLDTYHTNDSNKGKCKSNGKLLSTTVSSCK
ncbi:prepilin-type N-terminal cleavage/methylation domain-containing protein [bacterium]|nr:prepilin-type N-terminal cleavage/methylation domain-containing protein [bacterium]